MQALFENPLAEPGLLGVSNGAGVGLIAAVLLGKGVLPGWALGLCAIFGALLITLFCCVSPAAICLPAVCCWRGWRWDHLQRP
ncbi:Vitamin B12 ABC transporter [Klebsiella pneumoniae]|uniref:Vitamin B12 ABC transporter n=1 Tax=Klebsiella pneumoniae TaxID=573 RepID=A0A378H4G1_KLEPN|nr:Vitamin B12 ABC transporter [Klebsiella pneumoniae]